MVLCNLIYLKNEVLSSLSQIFESKFQMDVSLDTQFVIDTANSLERIIVFNFAKRQNAILRQYVTKAVFYSGLDWACLVKPQEIRAYCHHILHHLVYVHASITEISKSLISKIMSEILIFLVQELLIAFRQVDRFSISGMLQV